MTVLAAWVTENPKEGANILHAAEGSVAKQRELAFALAEKLKKRDETVSRNLSLGTLWVLTGLTAACICVSV